MYNVSTTLADVQALTIGVECCATIINGEA